MRALSAGELHLLLFGLVLPIAAMATRPAVRSRATMPRLNFYVVQLAQMILLTALSLYVAHKGRIKLFPARAPSALALGAGLLCLAAMFAVGYPIVRQTVEERRPIVALLTPSTALERVLWIAIALMAGFGEEVSWRGVQTALLSRYTGGMLAASAIAVFMFAAAHAVQSAKSVAAVALFAIGFHLLVLISGSLYVAMGVHFLYDAIIGFVYGRLARQLGYATPDAGAVPLTPADPA